MNGGAHMFEASHLQHNIESGYITIVADGNYLPAFWAHPQLGGPFPGAVLLHDLWGLTPHIRAQARRLAEQGYYVVAPDLFNRQLPETREQAAALLDQIGAAAEAHATGALHALATHHRCNSRISAIGWGRGGVLAIRLAVVRDDIHAAISFYGLSPDLRPAELRMLECPLLAIFGGQDPFISAGQIEALRDVLGDAAAPHEVVVYPDATREFFDDSRGAFHPDAAADAWTRLLAFLHTHLGPAGPGTPEHDAPLSPE